MADNALLIPLALVATAGLVWWFLRSRGNDRFNAFMTKTPAAGAIRSRAQLIDGGNHILVALTLEPQQISYQNADLDGSIAMSEIDEVEYGSDLITGGIADGAVLRLRSHGRAFEFVIDNAAAEQWSHHLPPHRMNELGNVHAI